MSLMYVPVSTDENSLVNQYHPNTLFNPIRQNFNRLNEIMPSFDVAHFADSGGLQLFNFEKNPKKPCIVVTGVGIRKQKDLTVIDPIDVCRCYGKLKVKFGFTLDHPLSDIAGPDEYNRRLRNSYMWASLMFDVRKKLCPGTELFVPLQFITKTQLHEYFEKMATLSPNGYAFPGRGRWNLAKSITISCTLCYLHSKKVEKVHLLGSSRREIIIIAAVAIGLKMFNQISFDSRTWNTGNFNTNAIMIDPKTLSQRRVEQIQIEDLPLIENLIEANFLEYLENTNELLLLHNAFAISQYADRLADIATDIPALKKYLPFIKIRGSGLKRVLTAIDILETYLDKGYGFLEKWLSGIWI